MIKIRASKTHSVSFRVELVFQVTQHSRDEKLMRSLIELLKCGNIFKYQEAIDFRVYNFREITLKIIPFFKKYPILGVKAEDFQD